MKMTEWILGGVIRRLVCIYMDNYISNYAKEQIDKLFAECKKEKEAQWQQGFQINDRINEFYSMDNITEIVKRINNMQLK